MRPPPGPWTRAGILIADHRRVRRTTLAPDGLYRADGPYRYRGGWNPAAVAAFAAGSVLTDYGWAVGLARRPAPLPGPLPGAHGVPSSE